MHTVGPKLKLRPLIRKQNESKEVYLARVNKRLGEVQNELNVWITNPTREGVLITHRLEDEKQLILKIIALVMPEEEAGR